MKNSHRENKQAIRNFMQKHYTDERLAMLLAHAQGGKLIFSSCCCFIGISNANHTLRSESNAALYANLHGQLYRYASIVQHWRNAKLLSGALAAENGFLTLGRTDAARRRILIPMIRAEMKRREKIRVQVEWKEELVAMTT